MASNVPISRCAASGRAPGSCAYDRVVAAALAALGANAFERLIRNGSVLDDDRFEALLFVEPTLERPLIRRKDYLESAP